MTMIRKPVLAVILVLALMSAAFAMPIDPTVGPYAPDAATVGLYHLDGGVPGQATVYDSGPYGVNGFRGYLAPWNAVPEGYTGNWGPMWGTGHFGGGLEFHGQDTSWPAYDYGMSISPHVSQNTLSMTVELWIKPTPLTTNAGYQSIIEKWWQYDYPSGCRFRIGYDDRPDIGHVNRLQGTMMAKAETTGELSMLTFYSGDNVITKDIWQHIAMTVDDATKTAKLWVNGATVASLDFTGYTLNLPTIPGSYGGPDSHVGDNPWDSYGFQGSMDEIRLSSVAREFVPEPATMVLLGIGGLLLRKRYA